MQYFGQIVPVRNSSKQQVPVNSSQVYDSVLASAIQNSHSTSNSPGELPGLLRCHLRRGPNHSTRGKSKSWGLRANFRLAHTLHHETPRDRGAEPYKYLDGGQYWSLIQTIVIHNIFSRLCISTHHAVEKVRDGSNCRPRGIAL
jgi:hypothetical protein